MGDRRAGGGCPPPEVGGSRGARERRWWGSPAGGRGWGADWGDGGRAGETGVGRLLVLHWEGGARGWAVGTLARDGGRALTKARVVWGHGGCPRRSQLKAHPAHPLARRGVSGVETSCHLCSGVTAWDAQPPPGRPYSACGPQCALRSTGSEPRRMVGRSRLLQAWRVGH